MVPLGMAERDAYTYSVHLAFLSLATLEQGLIGVNIAG